MAFEEWRDLMTDDVTIEAPGALNDYGQPQAGATRTVKAYVAGRQRLVRSFTGDERLSTVQVYMADDLGTGPSHRVTLPSRFTPQSPPLLAVEKLVDETGAVAEVLYA